MSTNGSLNQWIDLGIHTETCVTKPETCGAAGGAISVWMNIVDCPQFPVSGVISTRPSSATTGSTIDCGNTNTRLG